MDDKTTPGVFDEQRFQKGGLKGLWLFLIWKLDRQAENRLYFCLIF